VTFLIDGYNLMHAVGLLAHNVPRADLTRTRVRLLDWLANATDGRDAVLRVVFDAQGAPAASPETDHRGVRVRFAFRQTADDEIEELLAAEPLPGRVTVVSNDSRVQDAGRRRGTAVFTCQQFVDWLIETNREQGADAPRSPDKPEPTVTADEMAAWLAAFSAPKTKRRKS
jgi:predicted RNA-binding protein with PIN domain